MDPRKAKEAGMLILLMILVSSVGGILVSYGSLFMLVEFVAQALALFFAGLYAGKLRWGMLPAATLGIVLGIAGAIAATAAEWLFSVHEEPLVVSLGAFAADVFYASLFLAAAGLVLCLVGWGFRRKLLEE
jgi:hypothetical protein